MKRFSTPGLLMITALGGIFGHQLWQRRKLRRLARRVNYEGRLMHAAIRVTNEVRGSIDIARMLETTVVEVARTLEIEHCCIRFDGDNADNRKEGAFACSCGETAHEPVTGAAFTAALNALGDGRADRFLCHGHPNRCDSKNEPNAFPVLGLPINRDGDRLDGALLVLSHNAARVWLESEMQMLLAVAHQLSLSLSHARLFAATEFNSLSDALTGCLNPRGFEIQFENHFRAAQEHKTPISLVMIDLDSFKDINDDYGHAIGNTALRTLAGILLQETVTGAIAARIGGDEFALIMPSCPLEQAVGTAERVRRCVEISNNPDLDCKMTVSVGVASFPLHADSRKSLYMAADKALYRAKNSGRNRVCVA